MQCHRIRRLARKLGYEISHIIQLFINCGKGEKDVNLEMVMPLKLPNSLIHRKQFIYYQVICSR